MEKARGNGRKEEDAENWCNDPSVEEGPVDAEANPDEGKAVARSDKAAVLMNNGWRCLIKRIFPD